MSSFTRWRKKIGLTQEATARLLGVTLRTVQHWEAGTTSAGNESAPPLIVRLAMTALVANPKLEPWPK